MSLSTRDQVRLQIGDTDTGNALFTDAEIDSFLERHTDQVLPAAADACDALAARFARDFDFKWKDGEFKKDRFDVSRGVRLTSFAEPNIAGEIKRHFRDHGWSVHMPRDLQELHARIARETARVSGTLGRAPTVAELAERLETSHEHVVQAMLGARNYHASSLDEPDETGETRAARIGGDDDAFDHAEMRILVRKGATALGERERRIVELRYLHDLSQSEIAKRVGISQMHVSRLLRRSLETMREEIEQPRGERAA